MQVVMLSICISLDQRHSFRWVKLLVQLDFLQGLGNSNGEFINRVGTHASHLVAAVDRAHLRILVQELGLALELNLAQLLGRWEALLLTFLVLGRIPL